MYVSHTRMLGRSYLSPIICMWHTKGCWEVLPYVCGTHKDAGKVLPNICGTHKDAGNNELDDEADDGVRQPVVRITPVLRDNK